MKIKYNKDISIPFLLSNLSVRGRFLRLEEVSTKILKQHVYPLPIARVLTEILAASAALAGFLKYEGVFTLQTKSNGPIELLVVDMTHTGNMRGYVQFRKKSVKAKDSFADLFGEGYLAFTVDEKQNLERYQGIVNLNRESLTSAIEHYFDQSEQLKTRVVIASQQSSQGKWISSVLLLQQMPSLNPNEDSWNYIDAILSTLTQKELLDFSIPYETFLWRLFHETGLQIFDPLPLQAQCRCSEERIKVFLTTLSSEEIEGLLKNGQLKITCEFCNHTYKFNRNDLMTVH